MAYHDDLGKYYSQTLLGQEINENNAVVTATSNAVEHGGHTSIYTERLANNQPENKKIHLTTPENKSITINILNNMTARMGEAVAEANKRSWVVDQSKVDVLIAKAQEIKNNSDSYKYKRVIVGAKKNIFKKKKRLNCALFGESILKAAGIKASSGLFNKPSTLTKGKNKGHTQDQEFVDYEEQKRQEAERQHRQEAESAFYENIRDGRYYINKPFKEGDTVRGTIDDPSGDLDQEFIFSADTTEENKLPLNLGMYFVDRENYGHDRVRVFHKDRNYYIRMRDMIEYKPQ